MNTTALETFARDTRKALMDAVERKLDYVLRADTADLRAAAAQVASLRESARRDRPALVERVAYTWFNRLTALRFLDARDWHPFGVRVLTAAAAGESQPGVLKAFRAGELPEELTPFTPVKRLNDLLDGRLPTAIAGADPQGEVYRHLILAACRYYHDRMPFLFEAIDDETELLLPDDLLTSHSIAEGFRTEIRDDDCGAVEVLGWLYQFYISGKKDQVMARKAAVPSADIPAVTQLFTPHWIVRYLVENSLGRLWLLNRPASKLRASMPYYVEDAPAPSPQPPAPFPHLDRPEDIRLLDPACGSGHMLTYAFDLLYAIYAEEGYPPADIPGLILAHNLHGLEICPRATQLAQFALVCKARERNRNAFCQPIEPQVMCLQNVVIGDGELAAWAKAMKLQELIAGPMLEQLHQFNENTDTFGSLIQPVMDPAAIVGMKKRIGDEAPPGDLFLQDTHRKVRLVLDQAEMLSQRYQVVVTNPPYMGGKQMNGRLREFAADLYPDSKADLFAMFIERGFSLAEEVGYCALITMQNWMFLSSFGNIRSRVLSQKQILSMAHLGPRAFDTIAGEVVQATAFVLANHAQSDGIGTYFRLIEGRDEAGKASMYLLALEQPGCSWRYKVHSAELFKIPGSPVAYWVPARTRAIFQQSRTLGSFAKPRQGLATTNNDKFIRFWYEVELRSIGFGMSSESEAEASRRKWFPIQKGGSYRKWFGNNDLVVNYENNGEAICSYIDNTPGVNVGSSGRVINRQFYFREGITWSSLSSASLSMRYMPPGFIFETKGSACFCDDRSLLIELLGYANSVLVDHFLGALSPTLDYHEGPFGRLPIQPLNSDVQQHIVLQCVSLARTDWEASEIAPDFCSSPIVEATPHSPRLEECWVVWHARCMSSILSMQKLEEENNRIFIESYGMQSELSPNVPLSRITLNGADRRADMAAFLSYAVGCMMGRYSLDNPGLILADAGDTVEQYLAKVGKPREQLTFAPDEDGIVPVLDGEWFDDDVVARVREFLRATFGEASLDENLRFIEESLGKDLRAYFVTQFYKDHLQTYKKRPIYWLFQSPNKSFQCLVYLHRYTRDTANRVLNRYLREYLAKLRAAIGLREHTLASEAASARDKTRARKEAEQYRKALRECEDWERGVLLPLAQQRVELDLDDGVKVNYLKLGEALAPIPGLATAEEA